MAKALIGNIKGPQGDTGTVFTPHVAENGDLSWTNDAGLENPKTVNIRGPEGKEGERGEQGIPGTAAEKGATFTPHVAENGDLSWTNDAELPNPDIVNIRGPKGPASFEIGHGLSYDPDTDTVSVDMYGEGKDETLPVSEARMMEIVGDIETLLREI